jgi:hypothetical protein
VKNSLSSSVERVILPKLITRLLSNPRIPQFTLRFLLGGGGIKIK